MLLYPIISLKTVCPQRPGRSCETTETNFLVWFAFIVIRVNCARSP